MTVRNPAVFYSIAFLLITAAGVAILRSKLGALEALDSHYRIYSSTLLTLSFIFVAQTVWTSERPQKTKHCSLISFALIISIPFCLVSDRNGYRLLKTHRQEFTRGMLIWERPDLIPPDTVPVRDSVSEDRLTHVYDLFGESSANLSALEFMRRLVLSCASGAVIAAPISPQTNLERTGLACIGPLPGFGMWGDLI